MPWSLRNAGSGPGPFGACVGVGAGVGAGRDMALPDRFSYDYWGAYDEKRHRSVIIVVSADIEYLAEGGHDVIPVLVSPFGAFAVCALPQSLDFAISGRRERTRLWMTRNSRIRTASPDIRPRRGTR